MSKHLFVDTWFTELNVPLINNVISTTETTVMAAWQTPIGYFQGFNVSCTGQNSAKNTSTIQNLTSSNTSQELNAECRSVTAGALYQVNVVSLLYDPSVTSNASESVFNVTVPYAPKKVLSSHATTDLIQITVEYGYNEYDSQCTHFEVTDLAETGTIKTVPANDPMVIFSPLTADKSYNFSTYAVSDYTQNFPNIWRRSSNSTPTSAWTLAPSVSNIIELEREPWSLLIQFDQTDPHDHVWQYVIHVNTTSGRISTINLICQDVLKETLTTFNCETNSVVPTNHNTTCRTKPSCTAATELPESTQVTKVTSVTSFKATTTGVPEEVTGTTVSDAAKLSEHDLSNSTAQSICFNISGLEPYINYSISVQAVNPGGCSVRETVALTTDEWIPGCVNITHLNESYDSIEVHWNPPDKPNGIITQYVINYTRHDGLSSVMTTTNDTFCILQALEPFVEYNITVAAETRVGVGEVCPRSTTSAKTRVTKPHTPILAVYALSATSINISWTLSTDAKTGPETYYNLTITDVVNATWFVMEAHVEGFHNRAIVVEGLDEYWEYSVAIVAYTIDESEKELTTEGDTVTIRTLESTPGPVQSLNATSLSQINQCDTARIDWTAPTDRDRNGAIRGYRLEANVSTFEIQTFPPSATNAEVAVDPNGQAYTFTMMANTSVGFGTPVSTVLASTGFCQDPCSFSTGLTTAVGSATDDPCTTVNTRAETTAAETIAETATTKVTTSLPATPTVPIPSTLGTTTSRAETTTTPPHDLCNPSPCRNGATCVVHGNTFNCSCVPGFTGQNCSVEINECESSPCYPFGKCTDLIGDYNCSCNQGYEPLPNNTKTCNETDFCAKENQPCENGGTCINQNALSRYYCICPFLEGKQYVGLLCETELITKPIVNGGISPTSGIIAGGADVTIRGQGMNVFEPLGAYLIDTTPSPLPSLYAYAIPNLTLSASITVRIPPAENASYVDQNLLMIVEYTGPINVTTEKENLRFKYTGNPVIETIEPKEILVLGGVHLTVSGSNMNTVQYPMMDITTVVVNKTTPHSETNYSREICSLKNASAMTCLVPHGIVPSSFFRDTKPIGEGFHGVVHLESSFRHKTGSRRRKRAPVANLTDEAGSTFEMYLGFIFDEFPTYNNISKSLPHVSLTLVSPRVNFTPGISMDFVSNKMDTISLYGSGFTYGCSMGDYQVSVSNAPCTVTSLTDNELQCQPPKEEPPINDSSSFCVSASDPHPVKVFIGGETHLGCCLSYTTDYTDIIIAVTVSCVVVVAIIILVAVLVYKRHRKNKGADHLVRNAKHSSTDLHPPKEETVNGQTPANNYDYMVPHSDDAASTFVGMNPGKQTTTFVEMPLRSHPTSTRPVALASDDYLKPRDSKVVLNDYGDIRGDSSARTRDNYADVDDIGQISFKEHGTRPISDPEIDYLFNDNGEIDDIRGDSSGRTYDNYGHVDDVGELSIKKHGTRPLSEPEIDY